MRAQYAASRLAIVKVDLPKGTGGLTGHHHASPSHDSAAHTGGWRRPLLRSVRARGVDFTGTAVALLRVLAGF